MKILLPVDGSKPSLQAVDVLIQQAGEFRTKPEIELVTVHLPVPKLPGPVAETIVKHAKSARCDMICIGSRGLGQVGSALLGSTASKVLHLASVPLLIVK